MTNQNTFHNGDIYEFKKTHPCGGNNWKMIRVGVDCKLECTTCKRIIIIARIELPKKIKRFVFREEIPV
jgi:hypothetical protein